MPGIKETEEVVKAVVAIGNAIKTAKETNGGIGLDDISLALQVLPVIQVAVVGASEVMSELKDIDVEEVKQLAAATLGDAADGKLKTIVEEAFVLLECGVKGTASIKRVLAL